MATHLSSEKLVEKRTLCEIGETRLHEARVLLERECFAAAMYLGGYAVECYLKAAICKALDWTELRPTFAVHDLEGLLLHSGLSKRLEEPGCAQVRENFNKVKDVWIIHGKQSIRYAPPALFSRESATKFLAWIADPQDGVVPWVKARI